MSEQAPDSIDLRDQLEYNHDSLVEKLKVLQGVFQAFRHGSIPKGESFVFPEGFFAQNQDGTKELLSSVTNMLIAPTPNRELLIQQRTSQVGEYSVLKGHLFTPKDIATRTMPKHMPMWFAIDSFGDHAALTSEEPTEELLTSLKEI